MNDDYHYDARKRTEARLPTKPLPTGRNVLERADPIVVKRPTDLTGVVIARVKPGIARGLESPEMRVRGERGTEARLPPPTRKAKKERILLRASHEQRAAQLALVKYGK